MDEQITICEGCRHKRMDGGCYLKSRCVYEQKKPCAGCIDYKKKTYKGTKCLKCKRWCFSPAVVVSNLDDCWRDREVDE